MARTSRTSSYTGPIFDVHTHPMLDAEPILGTEPHGPDDYLRAVRGLGVRRAAILTIAPRGDLTRTRHQNDRILEVSEASGGRFLPFCSVHPFDGRAAVRELGRVARAGARGLKLHPNTQSFDVADRRVTAVVREASRLALPILFDAYSPFDPAQPGKFVRLAMAVPSSRLILAHALGPAYPELLVYEILARYPWWKRNVWVDLSATGPLMAEGPFADSFAWVLRKVGIDRLVFGSDYPLDDPRSAARAIASLPFTRDEQARIFYRNAVDLIGE